MVLSITVLTPEEEFLQFLDPSLCELEETIEAGGLRLAHWLCGKGQGTDYGHRQFEALRPHRRCRSTKLGGTIIFLVCTKTGVCAGFRQESWINDF